MGMRLVFYFRDFLFQPRQFPVHIKEKRAFRAYFTLRFFFHLFFVRESRENNAVPDKEGNKEAGEQKSRALNTSEMGALKIVVQMPPLCLKVCGVPQSPPKQNNGNTADDTVENRDTRKSFPYGIFKFVKKMIETHRTL